MVQLEEPEVTVAYENKSFVILLSSKQHMFLCAPEINICIS